MPTSCPRPSSATHSPSSGEAAEPSTRPTHSSSEYSFSRASVLPNAVGSVARERSRRSRNAAPSVARIRRITNALTVPLREGRPRRRPLSSSVSRTPGDDEPTGLDHVPCAARLHGWPIHGLKSQGVYLTRPPPTEPGAFVSGMGSVPRFDVRRVLGEQPRFSVLPAALAVATVILLLGSTGAAILPGGTVSPDIAPWAPRSSGVAVASQPANNTSGAPGWSELNASVSSNSTFWASSNYTVLNGSSNSSAGGPFWNLASTSGGPGPLAGFGFVYDPSVGKLLLFGGCASGLFFNGSCNPGNQTWTYSQGNWTQLFPASAPSARLNPQTLYLPSSGDVLLFGGGSGAPSYLDYHDTWEFNGTNWSQVVTTRAPTGGPWDSMAYDPAASEVILFDSGELYATGSGLANTWTFSGGQWNLLVNGTNGSATSPSPRSGETLTYDVATQSLILFGGFTCNSSGGCFQNGDTWSFAGGNWTQVNTSNAPSARNEMAAAYDPP